MNIGSLNSRCRIEYKVTDRDPVYRGETIVWTLLAVVWCNISDVLPAKSEVVKADLMINVNRTQVIMRYRNDVDSSMRLVINRPNPVYYQIVSGPAEIGEKDGLQLFVEAYSSKGG